MSEKFQETKTVSGLILCFVAFSILDFLPAETIGRLEQHKEKGKTSDTLCFTGKYSKKVCNRWNMISKLNTTLDCFFFCKHFLFATHFPMHKYCFLWSPELIRVNRQCMVRVRLSATEVSLVGSIRNTSTPSMHHKLRIYGQGWTNAFVIHQEKSFSNKYHVLGCILLVILQLKPFLTRIH